MFKILFCERCNYICACIMLATVPRLPDREFSAKTIPQACSILVVLSTVFCSVFNGHTYLKGTAHAEGSPLK